MDKLPKKNLKLSPNEIANILQNERNKWKNFRIQQVRAQSREEALRMHEEIKKEEKRQIGVIGAKLTDAWNQKNKEQIEKLEKKYNENCLDIGKAHQDANTEVKVAEKLEKDKVAAKKVALIRGRRAFEELDKNKMELKQTEITRKLTRQTNLKMEKRRAALIAKRPTPKKFKVTKKEKAPVPKKVEFYEAGTFTTSKYVPKEAKVVKEETANNMAINAAKREYEELETLERLRSFKERMQENNAESRFKAAKKKQETQQEYDRVIGRLEKLDSRQLSGLLKPEDGLSLASEGLEGDAEEAKSRAEFLLNEASRIPAPVIRQLEVSDTDATREEYTEQANRGSVSLESDEIIEPGIAGIEVNDGISPTEAGSIHFKETVPIHKVPTVNFKFCPNDPAITEMQNVRESSQGIPPLYDTSGSRHSTLSDSSGTEQVDRGQLLRYDNILSNEMGINTETVEQMPLSTRREAFKLFSRSRNVEPCHGRDKMVTRAPRYRASPSDSFAFSSRTEYLSIPDSSTEMGSGIADKDILSEVKLSQKNLEDILFKLKNRTGSAYTEGSSALKSSKLLSELKHAREKNSVSPKDVPRSPCKKLSPNKDCRLHDPQRKILSSPRKASDPKKQSQTHKDFQTSKLFDLKKDPKIRKDFTSSYKTDKDTRLAQSEDIYTSKPLNEWKRNLSPVFETSRLYTQDIRMEGSGRRPKSKREKFEENKRLLLKQYIERLLNANKGEITGSTVEGSGIDLSSEFSIDALLTKRKMSTLTPDQPSKDSKRDDLDTIPSKLSSSSSDLMFQNSMSYYKPSGSEFIDSTRPESVSGSNNFDSDLTSTMSDCFSYTTSGSSPHPGMAGDPNLDFEKEISARLKKLQELQRVIQERRNDCNVTAPLEVSESTLDLSSRYSSYATPSREMSSEFTTDSSSQSPYLSSLLKHISKPKVVHHTQSDSSSSNYDKIDHCSSLTKYNSIKSSLRQNLVSKTLDECQNVIEGRSDESKNLIPNLEMLKLSSKETESESLSIYSNETVEQIVSGSNFGDVDTRERIRERNSTSSSSSFPDMNDIFQKFGLPWAKAMIRKMNIADEVDSTDASDM